jgi:hypothetical protein
MALVRRSPASAIEAAAGSRLPLSRVEELVSRISWMSFNLVMMVVLLR